MHRGQYGGADILPRSPLVGRSGELECLEVLYRGACEGAGAFVLLWGEAGVGKTRLLEECGSRAAAAGALVARATCFEHLCPPFAPWRESFAALGLVDHFGAVAEPVTTRTSAEMEKYRSFVAAAEALRAAADAAPILITIDDLQWADFATLEFLAFAARRVADARVLVLACARSDDLESDHIRREALEKVRREGAQSIRVAPLDDDDMRELLQNLQPPDAPVDAQRLGRIRALAEGKPYFAEELFSSAVYAPANDPFDAAPLSIRAGVLARFERLTPAQRNVLLCAAVIGRSFTAPLLAGLTGVSLAQLSHALASARDALLVRDPRDPSEQFEFRHAITREILYRELLWGQAKTMHGEIARCLEADPGGDAVAIAHHWAAAGEAARAVRAFETAGDEAAARNAYRDAEAAYRRAAEADVDAPPAWRASLCEKLCRASSINGSLNEACTWGQRALDAYTPAGDRASAIAFALFLARRYGDAGRQEEGIATVGRALSLLDESSDAQLRYAAHVTLARLQTQRGRVDDALRELAKAESIPGEHPLRERHLFYDFRADIRAGCAQLALALADSAEAIRLAREIGEAERLSITLSNYARFAFFAGRTSEAAAAYDEAVALTEREHLGRAAAIVGTALAYVKLLTGDFGGADAERARARHAGGGPAVEVAGLSAGLRIAYLRDDEEAARRYEIDAAVEAAFRSEQPDAIGLLGGSVAAYWDSIGNRREAEALRSRALAWIVNANLSLWLLDQLATSPSSAEVAKARDLLQRAAGDPDHAVAHAHLALFDARAAYRRRDRKLAKHHAAEAVDRFTSIGWPWEHAQALELAGRAAEALDVYRRGGYLRDERRLTAARRRVRHRAGSDRLTQREFEVAALAADGRSNREIGQALQIGERTVETHIASIFDRFDLTSRHQLARIVEAHRPRPPLGG